MIQSLIKTYCDSQKWEIGKGLPFMDHGLIYISGPMTDLTNFNREAFWLTEMAINQMGYSTCSPAHWMKDRDYDWYMREDFALVMKCDGVFALKGYKESKGAMAEVTMARMINLLVIEEI